jgi:hypothetical protein
LYPSLLLWLIFSFQNPLSTHPLIKKGSHFHSIFIIKNNRFQWIILGWLFLFWALRILKDLSII